MIFRKQYLFLVLLAVAFQARSQQISNPTVNAFGGAVSNNQIVIQVSAGEPLSAANDILLSASIIDLVSESPVTAIDGLSQTSVEATVYPNPFRYAFQVRGMTETEVKYEIMNVHGQVVKHGSIGGINRTIRTEELNTGNYLLKVFNKESNQVQLFKLIKSL